MQAVAAEFNPASTRLRRQTMVDCQVRTFDVTDQRLIARMLAVPRELFLPNDLHELAYSDVGLSLDSTADEPGGCYQLPPMVLARLIQGARVVPRDRVLDVGGGTGYSTAILAALCADVVALEASTPARRRVESALSRADLAGIQVIERGLQQGVAEAAPFDVILVNGSVEAGLDPLFAQLADGGRLVAIVRSATDPSGRASKALCFEKRNGATGQRYLFDASSPVLDGFRKHHGFVF